MGRNRVLSFMSQLSSRDAARSTTPPTSVPPGHEREVLRKDPTVIDQTETAPPPPPQHRPNTPPPSQLSHMRNSPQAQGRPQRERAGSRPQSMLFPYQPPLMEMNQDTIPELQPIFTYLNSAGNKLYQEGYFLKLDDQNTQGRTNADRTWTECYAQLVGTILSWWDAAELDAAGEDGEVLPKFINLTDASIRMIEQLPTQSSDGKPLENILSISTAARNRYLLNFGKTHFMIQWTAAIRLALFEHTLLQESYTGALIAGKGKTLNNINLIMERSKLKHEDWARVRFGAGTPWRRCWCVITPPDEKEYQRLQKSFKKKSAYNRSKPVLKGTVKFYETRKTKKTEPIATITNAYAAYAIYPQSKPLIEMSTLVKVEGSILLHSKTGDTTSEGFVFVMPEVHPAVSGFEMMLRWLLPVFDTFALYGRPNRLIAETLDARSLMFAMPRERHMSYLENLDVANLILTEGSQTWRDEEWRAKLKEMTAKRMATIAEGRAASRMSSRRHRNSLPGRPRVSFGDGASVRSTGSVNFAPTDQTGNLPRTDSAPPSVAPFEAGRPHTRSASDTHGMRRYKNASSSSSLDTPYESGPTPPPHQAYPLSSREGSQHSQLADMSTPDRMSSEDEYAPTPMIKHARDPSIQPVAQPPKFHHPPGTKPSAAPYHSPELRRANSRMSSATLSQLAASAAMNGGVYAQSGNSSSENLPEPPRHQIPAALQVGRRDVDPFTEPAHPLPAVPPHINEPFPPLQGPEPEYRPTSSPHAHLQTMDPGASQTLPPSPGHRSHAAISAQPRTVARKPVPGLRPMLDDNLSDGASSNPPSYTSSNRDSMERVSMDRPRVGVMRTVGSSDTPTVRVGDIEYKNSDSRPPGDILDIDFGPTLNYASHRLPRESPTRAEKPRQHSRSPSQAPPPHEPPRTMAWQPGMGSGTAGGVTAEQFVRERATPLYSMRAGSATPPLVRKQSGDVFTADFRPPSQGAIHSRQSSGSRPTSRDAANVFGHSRNNSTDLLQRPNSRGAATVFGQSHSRNSSTDRLRPGSRGTTTVLQPHSRHNSSDLLRPSSRGAMSMLNAQGDVSNHLSAREQEHLARLSGAPLVHLTQRAEGPTAGLVGTIDVRERERRDVRHGLSNQVMQQAAGERPFAPMQMFPPPYGPTVTPYGTPGYPWPSPGRTSPGPSLAFDQNH